MISSVAPNQQVAFQLALLSSFLPTFILSGFIFPISSMPQAVQVITYVMPARYFIVALRAIVLKGAEMAAFWTDLLALAVFAAVMLTLASVRLGRDGRVDASWSRHGHDGTETHPCSPPFDSSLKYARTSRFA